MKSFVAAALGLAMLAPAALSAQPAPGGYWYNGVYHTGMYRGMRPAIRAARNGNFVGRIRSRQGSSLTMENGRTIFLQNGTSINGVNNGNLQAGMRIRVTGTGAGNGNINASNITVVGFR